MAEEGTIGLGRASRDERDDAEPSKEELQRRMEEARESITQTVTEIKETVTNQYYSMKETVTDALDWRHHFRKNPIAFSVGALSVGFLIGYGVVGSLKGRGGRHDGYPEAEETDVYARTGARPLRYEDEEDLDERHSAFHGHSYAAQPILDHPAEASAGERASAVSPEEADAAGDYRPAGASLSFSGPQEAGEEGAEGPQKPSLFERFKGTTAYDRLQSEVSSLGDRFIEELSTTAHTVVLPALFNKIKELFGVDLSGKQQSQDRESRQEGHAAAAAGGGKGQGETGARAAGAAASSSASASLASASRGTSAPSYATSENRGYGAQSNEGGGAEGRNRGNDDSVLDLDR